MGSMSAGATIHVRIDREEQEIGTLELELEEQQPWRTGNSQGSID